MNPTIKKWEQNEETFYHVAGEPGGDPLIMIFPRFYAVLSQKGWEDPVFHKDLVTVSLSDKKDCVIIQYKDSSKKIVKIPQIDFKKFILTGEIIDRVIEQMKSMGREYLDDRDEFYNGQNNMYRFDRQKKVFLETVIDASIGSSINEKEITEGSLKKMIRKRSNWLDLTSQGFEL